MKIYMFLLILAISCGSAFGQEETFTDVERLLQELSQARTDTARIVLKSRLSEAYRGSKPDTSLMLANQALLKAKELDFKKGEIMALNVLCVLYREKGNLPYALQLGLQALKVSEGEQYHFEEVNSLIRVANVYLSVGDASKALSYLHKADELLEKNYDNHQSDVTQYFMANNYLHLNQLDSAQKRLELLEKKHDLNPYWISPINMLRGNLAVKRGEYQQAILHFHKSLTISIAENSLRGAATASNSIAEIYMNLYRPDSAIYYAKKGLEFGEMLSYTNRILAASSLLAELYAETNPKEAIRYYQMASAAKDSLYGVKKFQQLQSATMEELERQIEMEAAAIAYQNQLRQQGLLVGVFIFLLVAIILYRNNRQKQKTNKVLETTLSNLKSTQAQLIQSEKMASLGELTAGIAHEIQNPLNFVNNFSEVNSELIDELDEEAMKGNLEEVRAIAKDIKENEQKINHHGKRADSIVKGMLQHSRTSNGTKESTDINALADEYLRLSYHGLRAKDKSFSADFKTDFEPNLPKVNVVPQDIGRVLLNLINNAFYACAERNRSAVSDRAKKNENEYKPEVFVTTKKLDNKIEIRVKDNGNGIPEEIKDKIFQPFFTTKPTGQGTGLGLSLAYDIVKAHGGEIQIDSVQGKGSEFKIILPYNNLK